MIYRREIEEVLLMLSSDEDSDLVEELVAQWDELTRPLDHQGPKISAAR